jgi:uncharacterized iron-regulated protein
MMKDLGSKDVILFGEFHDNPISHWLELEVLLKLNAMKPSATIGLGFEMFELHQKQALSDYISNQNYKQLKDTTTLWPNFKTDYKPALDSAIHFGNTAFAANITRKYARLVFKNGLVALDTLSAEEKQLIAPLPFPFDSTLSQYAELIKMGKEMHQSGINFALAQAIKDATMAHSIATQLKSTSTVLFLNGAYHSDFHQGIEWYLKQYTPNTRVGTISTVSQKELKQLDKSHHNRADYILVVNQNMGSTH